jgi:hypothetical protein
LKGGLQRRRMAWKRISSKRLTFGC